MVAASAVSRALGRHHLKRDFYVTVYDDTVCVRHNSHAVSGDRLVNINRNLKNYQRTLTQAGYVVGWDCTAPEPFLFVERKLSREDAT